MVATKPSVAVMPKNQRNILWKRLGFISRVRRWTTASFGRQKDMVPGQKPTMVQKMAADFCSVVRMRKCFPFPSWVALMPRATAAQPHI